MIVEEIRNEKEERQKKDLMIAVAASVEKNLVLLVLGRVQNIVAAEWRRNEEEALIKTNV